MLSSATTPECAHVWQYEHLGAAYLLQLRPAERPLVERRAAAGGE